MTPHIIHRTGLSGLLLLSVLLAISGCGGGASSIVPAAGGSTGTGTSVDAGSPDGDSRILPLGSALPAIPDDLNLDSSARASSELVDYSGAGFVEAAGATIDGDNVILQSSADAPAWALYKRDDLAGKYVASFSIQATPGGLDQQYSVGLSNFSDGRWEYFITSALPEVSVDLKPNTKRLISQLGNLYYVVIVSGGASATVGSATLDVSDTPPAGSAGQRPPLPLGLFASRGEPQVTLTWLADETATAYEVYRRELPAGATHDFPRMIGGGRPGAGQEGQGQGGEQGQGGQPGGGQGPAGQQQPPPPGGPDGGGPGGQGQGGQPPAGEELPADDPAASVDFTLLATVAEPAYVDASAVLDVFYEYKVRGISAAGPSGFGRPAMGFASNHLRLMGEIESIGADSITVDGRTLAITAGTAFIGEQGAALTIADFAAGDKVAVEGTRLADGSLAANAIRVLGDMAGADPGLGRCALGGELSAIDVGTLSVTDPRGNAHTYSYDAETKFLLEDGTVVASTDFAAGDHVAVFADGDPHEQGSYARIVQKHAAPPQPPAE